MYEWELYLVSWPVVDQVFFLLPSYLLAALLLLQVVNDIPIFLTYGYGLPCYP